MKIQVADYVAQFLMEKGITDLFSVVGGGSMFLNDAFGRAKGIRCIYNHHEQACAMAAEAYFKYKNQMAAVCVTSGPGGTNALTGVLGAWQDSIPLFIISGQVRYETTVDSAGLPLRQFGGQEHQIVDTVKNITKYAAMVKKAEDVRWHLEKAYDMAMDGRRGPVWLDIPLNVQSAEIETESLKGFQKPEKDREKVRGYADSILEEVKKAERPLIIAGSAVRSSGAQDVFLRLLERLHIPVTYPLVVSDLVSNENRQAVGCFGGAGTRAGNFAVQNADLLLVFGCRMAFSHIGFNYEKFSPASRKIVVDIDEAEQSKPTMKRDIKILADVRDILEEMEKRDLCGMPSYPKWNAYCQELKKRFPIYQKHHETSEDGRVNPYFMAKALSDRMDEHGIIALGNSSGLDPKLQYGIEKQGERVILNCNCGSMGYCLPAGIGAAAASGRRVVVYTGDGCMQMNIQELLTISHNKLPVKIIVLNNKGYGGVVATQTNFFDGHLCGCTEESGISMPDFEKLAYAYGFQYVRAENHEQVEKALDALLCDDAPAICEVYQDMIQGIEPRVSSRKLEDGTLVSTGIDDLAPFLPLEEYEACQYENWVKGGKE